MALSITASSLAERRAALAAVKKDGRALLDAEIKRHNDWVRQAEKNYQADVAAAEAALEARADELDRALASELVAELYPLLASFVASPRESTIAIQATWRRFAARLREETGDDLSNHLVYGLLKACGHGDKTGGGLSGYVDSRIEPAEALALRAIEHDAPPAALEAALRTLEAEVATWVIGQPDCPELSAIRRSRAGRGARLLAQKNYGLGCPQYGPVA